VGEVAGSNPVVPTIRIAEKFLLFRDKFGARVLFLETLASGATALRFEIAYPDCVN
jgi:hypothetical protein